MTTTEPQGKLDVTRVLERTLGLLKADIGRFLMAALICMGAPLTAIGLALAGGALGFPIIAAIGMFGAVIVFLAGAFLFQIAVIRMAAAAMDGRREDPWAATRSSVGLLLPTLGLGLVSWLGIVLGFMLLIVPGVMLACAWVVCLPVRVVEGRGIGRALSRSADLTRGNRWRIAGLSLLYFIGSGIVQGLVTAPLGGAETANSIVSLLLFPLQTIVSTVGVLVIYSELRAIKEGGGLDAAAVFD